MKEVEEYLSSQGIHWDAPEQPPVLVRFLFYLSFIFRRNGMKRNETKALIIFYFPMYL